MGLRPFLALILSTIICWVLIYFIVFGNSFNDFLNSFQLGVDVIKTNLLNICLIQFSVYPFLLSGNFILLISLLALGFSIGLICAKFSSTFLVILTYSLIIFLVPFFILIINGIDFILAINNIFLLFIGSSVLQILINLIMLEIFIIIPASIGSAITKRKID